MNRRCGHLLAALIAAAGAGAHAQVVPVYENDFESPNVTSCDASSFQSSGFTNSYNGTGVPPATFQQVNTADRLCVAQPVAAGPFVTRQARRAGSPAALCVTTTTTGSSFGPAPSIRKVRPS